MKRRQEIDNNYLEKIPKRPEWIEWKTDEDGKVTLEIENKGLMNKIMQKLLKKPKISYIHFDEIGSFVWPMIDGEKMIMDMGKPLEEHFGEKALPIYERLAKFFQILESYGFVEWI